MKYLKIENNKGFFLRESLEKNEWIEIDKISKEDLMILLETAVFKDFELDEYKEENIGHKAHQIVYKSIHEKFSDLISKKKSFKDECDLQFRSAVDKYETKE